MLGCDESRRLERKILSPAEKKKVGKRICIHVVVALLSLLTIGSGALKRGEVDRIDVVDAKKVQVQAVWVVQCGKAQNK